MHTTLITKVQHCLDLHTFLHTHFPFASNSDEGWAIHHVAIVATQKTNYQFLTAEELSTRFGFASDLINDFFEVHHWLYQTHKKQHGCPCQWQVEGNTFIGQGITYNSESLALAINQDTTHWRDFTALENAFYRH
jgi:hypothetical protein